MPLPTEFKDRSDKTADSNKFAYAPIDEPHNVLRSNSKPSVPRETSATLKSFDNPVNNSFQKSVATKASDLQLSAPQKSTTPTRTAQVQQQLAAKSPFKSLTKLEQPTIKTDVSIPKAPVMVEGVVKIAETESPTAKGRLVAAEQLVDRSSLVQTKRTSRADQLLENVDFFAEKKPVAPTPQAYAIPVQPAPQSQIVINVNNGNVAVPQPAQATNKALLTLPNFAPQNNQPVQANPANMVAQASSTTSVSDPAQVSTADIASAVRSKYALKGKCPVTLLSEGRWIDGKKEIGCVHRDRVYLFATAAHREAFLTDPDRLSPLLAGFDPVIFEETGKLIEGNEKFGTFMGKKPNQRIVLFTTSDTRDRFQKEPSKYLDVVRQAMTKNAPTETKLR